VTCPELCHWAARHREQLIPPTPCRATLSRCNFPAEQLSQHLLAQQLARSFVTGRLDKESNSTSDYLPSNSLTEQTAYRATSPAVILPATHPVACRANNSNEQLTCRETLSAVALPEQLFWRLAHQATYLPSISPIDSPRALSLAEKIS
jgi:hypothetical protein